MNCTDKLHHKTERDALNHLAWAKKQPGGHGIKHLNVYECPCGQGWCVGRSYRSRREALAVQPKAAPGPKLTAGQQRRAARKAAEKAAHQALYADYADTLRICRLLADRQMALYETLGVKPLPVTKPEERV